ncbi:MAG: hypothetical protein LBI54_01205 [Lachnospiraceae bacterium]|jgi:hypothetical protein|nr:hypothetical protein [Lachnospiraceae bacterium]
MNFLRKLFGGKNTAVGNANPRDPEPAKAGSGKTSDEFLVRVLFADFSNESEVLKLFPELARPLENQQTEEIIRILREKTKDPESRKALLAWYELQKYGIFPDEENADKILGIVVEASLERGIDYLAAYPDNAARYFNQRGAKIYYESAEYSQVNEEIGKLVLCAYRVYKCFDKIAEKRLEPLPVGTGQARINILTPGGLYIRPGNMNDLQSNEPTRDIISQAVALMRALMNLSS